MSDVETDPTELLNAICRNTVYVRALLQIHQQMFQRDSEEAGPLLDRAAGFSIVVRQALEDCLILGICRLTDEPSTGTRANLSFRQLAESLGAANHRDLAEHIEDGLNALHDRISRLRKHRNKHLAHNDLTAALKRGGALRSLSSRVYEDITACVDALHTLQNECQSALERASTSFEVYIRGDGKTLLALLRKAKRFQDLTKAFEIAHFGRRPPVEVKYNSISANIEWE